MVLREIILYFVLPAAAFIYFYLKKKFSYFENLQIPHTKTVKWPLGNLTGAGKDFHMVDLVNNVYKECKGKDVICGFYNLTRPVFLITDPQLAKIILVKDFNYFVNRGAYVNEVNSNSFS